MIVLALNSSSGRLRLVSLPVLNIAFAPSVFSSIHSDNSSDVIACVPEGKGTAFILNSVRDVLPSKAVTVIFALCLPGPRRIYFGSSADVIIPRVSFLSFVNIGPAPSGQKSLIAWALSSRSSLRS